MPIWLMFMLVGVMLVINDFGAAGFVFILCGFSWLLSSKTGKVKE